MPPKTSTMLPLGSALPGFDLPNTNPAFGADRVRSDDLTGDALVVMVLCNHCPFVIHIREQLAAIGRDYEGRASIVAVCANDATTHPADAPDKMAQEATETGYRFPYLHDARQELVADLGAACTPDFYVFDRDRKLVYRGQLDASRPGNTEPVTGADLRAAIDAAIAGNPPLKTQLPSIGCGIKWTPGREPAYVSGA